MAAALVQTPQPATGGEPNGTATVPTIHKSSLYVGDVDKDVTEEELYALFQSVSPNAFRRGEACNAMHCTTFTLANHLMGSRSRAVSIDCHQQLKSAFRIWT